MRIKATDELVMKMCALAVNASIPIGLGWLQYTPDKKFEPEEFRGAVGQRGCFLDCVQGRMVKLRMWRKDDGEWEVPDSLTPAYESWGAVYPSYAILALAAGVAC